MKERTKKKQNHRLREAKRSAKKNKIGKRKENKNKHKRKRKEKSRK